ncbi:MAG: hypothetical protein ABSH53_13055 [Holophaga sp.]|jgi:3-hydroxymyristoyl/3-hydroxydecanoyl-(acyl carrier protein) dehydratase
MMALPAVTPRGTGPDGEAVFTLAVGPEHPAFRGHFPGDPLLPGVVQVDWAVRLGREAFGPLGDFQGLDQAKFLRPVRPGVPLELRLALAPGSGRLRFQYQDAEGKVSSGTALFRP